MRIKVKEVKKSDKKRRFRRINLAVPNSFIKTRLAVTIIRKGLESKLEEGKTPIISPDYITRERLTAFYKCLKGVIKRNGHFNLVEVNAADGTKVVIRL